MKMTVKRIVIAEKNQKHKKNRQMLKGKQRKSKNLLNPIQVEVILMVWIFPQAIVIVNTSQKVDTYELQMYQLSDSYSLSLSL